MAELPNITDKSTPDEHPALPTYQSVAAVLEKQTGSGIKLVGWTFARSVLIIPGMLLVGTEWKKAVFGSLLASSFISVLALARVYNASFQGEVEAFARKRKELREARWQQKRLQRRR